jgi:hypothetical protein
LTGIVQRASSSMLARFSSGGRISSVGETSRSKRSNSAVSWTRQRAWAWIASVIVAWLSWRPTSKRRATSGEIRPASRSKSSLLAW